METVGSIFDKLTIIGKRREVLKATQREIKDEDHAEDLKRKLRSLDEQEGWLFIDMVNVIQRHMTEKRPLKAPKLKVYDADVSAPEYSNFVDLIRHLDATNRVLWDLEEVRRKRGIVLDNARLDAADQVSQNNKFRNDIIDAIDYYLEERLSLVKDN